MNQFDIGFTFGIFTAYASFTCKDELPCISASFSEDNADLTDHLIKIFGGRTFGPYNKRVIWRICSSEIYPIIKLLDLHLDGKKKEKYLTWKKKYLIS